MTSKRSLTGLLVWLVVCFAVAWFGSRFAPGSWYESLVKPPWTPPAWLFPPVWTILYALMAVAAWLVWKKRGFAEAGFELYLFLAQLLANALWSWLFFGLRQPAYALLDLGLLWILVLLVTVGFWRVTPRAGLLLTPYLAWASFALALNFSFWRLNR